MGSHCTKLVSKLEISKSFQLSPQKSNQSKFQNANILSDKLWLQLQRNDICQKFQKQSYDTFGQISTLHAIITTMDD